MMDSVIKPVYVTINSPAGLSREEEGALGVRTEGKEEEGLGEGAGGSNGHKRGLVQLAPGLHLIPN